MENQSKEELLLREFRKRYPIEIDTMDDFFEFGMEDEAAKATFEAMEQYATQQTAALEKEVERLRMGLASIIEFMGDSESYDLTIIRDIATKNLTHDHNR